MHSIQKYVEAIRKARIAKKWNQQQLAKKAGLTQSHLSRLERGVVDLRLSNMIELARLVDLEVMLVPRKNIPAIKTLLKELSGGEGEQPRQAYTLDDEGETH